MNLEDLQPHWTPELPTRVQLVRLVAAVESAVSVGVRLKGITRQLRRGAEIDDCIAVLRVLTICRSGAR